MVVAAEDQPSTSRSPSNDLEEKCDTSSYTDRKTNKRAWSAKSSWSTASWSHMKLYIDQLKAKPKPTFEDVVYRTPSIYRFISLIGFFIFYFGVIGNFMYISPKIRMRVRKVSQLVNTFHLIQERCDCGRMRMADRQIYISFYINSVGFAIEARSIDA